MQPIVSDSVTNLSPVAAQYGPFFFTLLYTLVVPLIGQQLIKRNIAKAGEISDAELSERISSQRMYRTFGIAMSAFCLTFSMFWWAFAQLYPPPSSEEAIKQKVEGEFKRRVVTGVIRGGNDDIAFLDPQDARYDTYISPERDRDPMTFKYVIVFKKPPTDNEQVNLLFLNLKTYRIIRTLPGPKIGYNPLTLTFCVNSGSQFLELDVANGAPRFKETCRRQVNQAQLGEKDA